MHTKKYFFIVCCLLAFGIFSCRKEMNRPSWDVDAFTPLINSTLSINNLLADSIVRINPDNSLDIVYRTSLYAISADSLFRIPDTTISNFYFSPLTTTINPGGGIINPPVSNNIKYSLGDIQLTQAIVREGKMLLTIKSGIQGKVDFTYNIPSMIDIFGNPFDTTVTIPAATSTVTPGIYSGSFDLSGYKVDLTGPNKTSFNTMMTSYSACVTPASNGGTVTTLNVGDAVQISNTFNDMVMEYAKGYFGSTVTNVGPATTDFSLFRHVIGGSLKLEDIDIGLSIENSIGADARIILDNLSSFNSRTNNSVPLSHSVIGSPININRSVDNNGVVSPSTYSVSFNPQNSNIKSFVENLPDKMSYQLRFQINPYGNLSGSNDFVYYNKLLKAEMNMTIPLSVLANDLTMADTLAFKMDAGTKGINSGNFYLYAENGFPFTAEAQLYLMDENFMLVDSLISSPNTILSPPLDMNLVAVGKRLTKLMIPVDAAKLELLRNTKNMYVKMKFNTSGQPNNVKVYNSYEIKIKLVGDFNYTIGKN